MSWNAFFGIASIMFLSFPAGVIISCRLYKHRSLAALLLYYILTILYLMMDEGLFRLPYPFTKYFGITINYLDAPLMLTALLFFCPSKQKQTKVQLIIAGFIVYEILMAILHGYTVPSLVYVLGPGLAIVLGYTFFLFGRQVKLTIVHGKNAGRTLMLAAILFSYSCFALIYYFYYVQQTPFISDARLLYFISSIVSSVLMGTGLLLMRKRIKELQNLQLTRRELAVFFGS